VFMDSSKSKNLHESRIEEARQTMRNGIPRRRFIKTGAAAAAAVALLGKKTIAANRPLKIGYVSPQTGALASFGETDNFVISEFRRLIQKGVSAGGSARPIEILVRDSQSDPNRASRVAMGLIKSDRVDLMLVAGTADTVNPVADQCEINQTPCLSSDTAWQAYFFGRGGKPEKGFDWTYHFFWGSETISQVEADIFGLRPTNKVVGCLWPNDPEGLVFSDPQRGYPPVFNARGYKVIDTGRFNPSTSDFSAQISEFKRANVEILHGILPSPAFATFWSQAAQQGFKPKIAQIGKALLFPAEVNSLGERARNLATEIWWSRNHPFKSGLTGKTPAHLCDAYEEVSRKQWSQAIGFRYALFELALDVLKRARNPESATSLIEAIRATRYQSVVGPIQWTGAAPNEWTHIPVKNVCTTPLVGGQWVPGKKWKYDLVVVTNDRYRIIPVQRQLAPL
jgi:branched-chain amino acid transport system substrate-binding protein